MKREIIQTADGSTTIHLPEWEESYHSKHGAIQEAYHVFITNGFSLFKGKPVSVLEIGFGTGLNAFITYLESKKNNQNVTYTAIEAYPVAFEEAMHMNYVKELDINEQLAFELLHQCDWEMKNAVNDDFELTKHQQFFQDITTVNTYDLIYFDAFGYRVQPELWSETIFAKMYQALKPGGILVTYACRTIIKNAMLSAGFSVEKLPGAPGKREMLRASKAIIKI